MEILMGALRPEMSDESFRIIKSGAQGRAELQCFALANRPLKRQCNMCVLRVHATEAMVLLACWARSSAAIVGFQRQSPFFSGGGSTPGRQAEPVCVAELLNPDTWYAQDTSRKDKDAPHRTHNNRSVIAVLLEAASVT